MALLPDIPINSPIADGQYLNTDYYQYLFALQARTQAASELLTNPLVLTEQAAAIAATPIPLPELQSGLYIVRYYARITTPASVNSSLTVTFTCTESGLSIPQSGQAITGNTTTTAKSESFVLLVDANSPITYATAYVSNLAGMKYRLTITVEALSR